MFYKSQERNIWIRYIYSKQVTFYNFQIFKYMYTLWIFVYKLASSIQYIYPMKKVTPTISLKEHQ
jgi:hypothetical protein